jgi:N-carbamoylputrescine amidase
MVCTAGLLLLPLLCGLSLVTFGKAQAALRPPKVRVAMCQTLCVDSDRQGNFERIEKALAEAQKGRAQIACLPESAILGWVNPEAHRLAYPIPGKDSDRLAELARRCGLMLCVGLEEKDGDCLYGSVILIDRDGRLLLKHRKINVLPELMTPPYTPGSPSDIKSVETEFGRIGLLICADTFAPRHLEIMRDQKPDLVLVPYGWAAKPEEWPQHGDKLRDTVAKAARVIGAPVVGTDNIGTITHGPWTGRTYGGQSVACDADGNVLSRGKDRESQVLVFDVPVGWKEPKKSDTSK